MHGNMINLTNGNYLYCSITCLIIHMINKVRKTLKALLSRVFFACKERKFKKRLKYLFYNNNSETLLIIFSAFSKTDNRSYNYVRSLSNLRFDKLYILDVWGYKGSYYLFENGCNSPEIDVTLLIKEKMCKKKYGHVYTAGTSKGGTAAIYYGLKFNVEKIFAGACQYNLGTYLYPNHIEIFKAMMGNDAGEEEVRKLNEVMRVHIRNHSDVKTIIYLIYSKNEHTYKDDIVGLLQQLKSCNYKIVEAEYNFSNHNDVGIYFKDYMCRYFSVK